MAIAYFRIIVMSLIGSIFVLCVTVAAPYSDPFSSEQQTPFGENGVSEQEVPPAENGVSEQEAPPAENGVSGQGASEGNGASSGEGSGPPEQNNGATLNPPSDQGESVDSNAQAEQQGQADSNKSACPEASSESITLSSSDGVVESAGKARITVKNTFDFKLWVLLNKKWHYVDCYSSKTFHASTSPLASLAIYQYQPDSYLIYYNQYIVPNAKLNLVCKSNVYGYNYCEDLSSCKEHRPAV